MMLSKHKHHPSSSSSTFELARVLLVTSVWLMATYNTHCRPYKTNDRQHVVAPWTVGSSNRPFDGICGNGLLDDVIDDGDSGNTTSTTPFKRKQAIGNKTDGLNQEKHHRLEMMPQNRSNQLIPIRLNIFYDATMANEFGARSNGSGSGGEEKLLKFVRNLIYETQLIFEQPEIYPYIKLNFIVVKLIQSRVNFHPRLDVFQMLDIFSAGADGKEFGSGDLNILMTYSSLWTIDPNKPFRKILGVARTGTLCRGPIRNAVLAFSAYALNSAVVLAHEIAHTLNSSHDGDSSGGDCSPDMYIMSPTSGPDKLGWSKCSVGAMMGHLRDNADRVFNPNRWANSAPLSDYFNFQPDASNAANRAKLPGIEFDLDGQCAQALDLTAASLFNVEHNNGDDRYETCQNLVCTMGKYMQVNVGPALTGSRCSLKANQAVLGTCFRGSCSTKYKV